MRSLISNIFFFVIVTGLHQYVTFLIFFHYIIKYMYIIMYVCKKYIFYILLELFQTHFMAENTYVLETFF